MAYYNLKLYNTDQMKCFYLYYVTKNVYLCKNNIHIINI